MRVCALLILLAAPLAAVPFCRRLTEALPALVDARMALGMCLQLTGAGEEAAREYRVVIELAPGSNQANEASRRIAQLSKRR